MYKKLKGNDEYIVLDVLKWWNAILLENIATNATGIVYIMKCIGIDRLFGTPPARNVFKSVKKITRTLKMTCALWMLSGQML